jgi:hypothetical protein
MQDDEVKSKRRGSLVTPKNAGLENAVGIFNAGLEFLRANAECTVENVEGGVCIHVRGVHSDDGQMLMCEP